MRRWVMGDIIKSVIAGSIILVVSKILEVYGGIKIIRSLYQSFIIELWPIWIGLLAASLYWIISDYIKLRRFKNKVEKWIGLFSYKDRYNDLKGKIHFYIKEELENKKPEK
jgi:hypothetical protein